MKRNLSLSLEQDIYREVKRIVPVGQISPLVNNLLKEYLKKQKERELKVAYQDFAKNKKLKEELAVWDEAVGDGIDDNNETIYKTKWLEKVKKIIAEKEPELEKVEYWIKQIDGRIINQKTDGNKSYLENIGKELKAKKEEIIWKKNLPF